MPKSEFQTKPQASMANDDEVVAAARTVDHSGFEIGDSFVIRVSSFGLFA
jgi:hypothetical protein